jgi:hypothetical protein
MKWVAFSKGYNGAGVIVDASGFVLDGGILVSGGIMVSPFATAEAVSVVSESRQ